MKAFACSNMECDWVVFIRATNYEASVCRHRFMGSAAVNSCYWKGGVEGLWGLYVYYSSSIFEGEFLVCGLDLDMCVRLSAVLGLFFFLLSL